MKIVHLMLSSFYIDNANYQENCLPRQNKLDGHDVTIIASTEVFIPGKNITSFISPSIYFNEDNILVHRLPYVKIIETRISKKIKKFKGLTNLLNEIGPDVIFFHGTSSYDLITVSNFCSLNPNVKFFVDCHSDSNNSARTFLSKFILHKIIYKFFIFLSYNEIDKIFYITIESKFFLNKIYNLPDSKLSYLPLGGFIIDDSERNRINKKIRTQLDISDDKLVIIHSGKMDKNKRTFELLTAFNAIKSNQFVLLLLGSMESSVSEVCLPLIKANDNIKNIGWVSGKTLQEYLYSGDIYVQLGSQSVTMQNAICAGCAVAIFPHESHIYLLKDVAFYVENSSDILDLLNRIASNKSLLVSKKSESLAFAKLALDYKIIGNIYLKD